MDQIYKKSATRAFFALFCLHFLVFFLGGLAGQAMASEDQETPRGDLAVVGGKIYTATGRIHEDGTVVIQGGKIAAVGSRGETVVPAGMATLSAKGRVVIPGLIDLWAPIPGGSEGGGQTHHRAGDLVESFPEAWRRSLSAGITTVGIAPVPVRGVGGLGALLKLRSAREGEIIDLRIRTDSHLLLALGMVPPGLGSPRITTSDRLEQYYALRSLFVQARDYRKAWDRYWEAAEKYNKEISSRLVSPEAGGEESKGKDPPAVPAPGENVSEKAPEKGPEKGEEKKGGDQKKDQKKDEKKAEKKPPAPPKEPDLDLKKEVLLRAMEGKLPVFLQAHKKADIGYALRLKEEFGLKLVILGATEGHLAAEEIGRSATPVSLGPALLTRYDLDLEGLRESNGAELASQGVPVSLSSLGGSAFPAQSLRLQSCILLRGGLCRDLALQAITSRPAEMLGISERLGTIESGKDGDLVLLDGDPLNALSKVACVIVEGRVVFEGEAGL